MSHIPSLDSVDSLLTNDVASIASNSSDISPRSASGSSNNFNATRRLCFRTCRPTTHVRRETLPKARDSSEHVYHALLSVVGTTSATLPSDHRSLSPFPAHELSVFSQYARSASSDSRMSNTSSEPPVSFQISKLSPQAMGWERPHTLPSRTVSHGSTKIAVER